MGGKTISEKILSIKSGKDVIAGDIVVSSIDYIMGHDGSFPLSIEVMEEIGNKTPFDPHKVGIVIDHYTPSPNEKVSKLHSMMREYSSRYGCNLYEVGEGICHQIIPESGKILPGNVVIGGDSHTCTYGALNIFATGVGSTDLAAAVIKGRTWFKVPSTIKVNLNGIIPKGVYAKDIILKVICELTAEGANYKAVEFHGDGVEQLSMDGRFTISNMVVEMGGKVGLMKADKKTIDWLKDKTNKSYVPVEPDADAVYERIMDIDLTRLDPQIAKPHAVDNVASITKLIGIPIQQATIGSCTNGRIEDLEIAAQILKDEKVHQNTRLFITPASRKIYLESLRKGLIEILVNAGAVILPPSCGWCCGSCNGIPSDGENVISTANRNFIGRMGNKNANIYLASPATVAASALVGKIADPREEVGF